MPAVPLARLRRLCLALPESTEIEAWDRPTFRVRGKIFAMAATQDEALAAWMKAPPGAQEFLIEMDPARFFRPPYVGVRGWIGVRLTGRVDWPELDDLIRRSYIMTAPKKLAASL